VASLHESDWSRRTASGSALATAAAPSSASDSIIALLAVAFSPSPNAEATCFPEEAR
jgi:hypothetical protein